MDYIASGELTEIRQQLMDAGIDERSVPSDPLTLFDQWLSFAFEVGIFNAHSMALATVSSTGQPSVRNVLARPVPASPVPANPAANRPIAAFYTDSHSQKATELETNPNVAAVFSWLELERQVRLEGQALPLGFGAVADYFNARPTEAQIAMSASQQSMPIADRHAMEQRFAEATDYAKATQLAMHQLGAVAHWNGYLLYAHRIEFWQGRSDRIHDRLVYQLQQPTTPEAPVDSSSAAPSELSSAAPADSPVWVITRLQP